MKKLSIFALALLLVSCGDNSVNISGTEEDPNGSYDPSTPSSSSRPSSSSVTPSCSSRPSSSSATPSSSSRPSSSSVTPVQTANAVILTLTYWRTTDTDIGGLDPKIYFKVRAYQNGRNISDNNSNVLLDEQDIPNTWTGSKRSSPVPLAQQADSLVISAVVVEKDTFSDDDISPSYYVYWDGVPPAGHSGSTTLDYGSGKSMVRFNYEFIRQ